MTDRDEIFEPGNVNDRPPVGKLVWVKCQGFRCLAYLGGDGKWRDIHHDELDQEIQIVHPT